MTALYIERYLNFGLTPAELRSGKPIIGIAQTGSDLRPVQSPSPRSGQARARRHHRGRRRALRIPRSSAPGDRQTPDRGARPQSRLSRPGRNPDGLFHRRRRAHHRLRQDDPRLHHGGGDGQHSRHRAFRRADEQRLASRRAHRLGHDRLEGARRTRRRQDRLRAIHGDRDLLGAVGRPLQHHGHRLDDERARRGARHEPARLRRHPRAASRTRADRLRDGPPHRRHGVGGFEALGHPHPRGLREHDRRQQRDRRLDQRADPRQRDRAPYRRQAQHRRLGEGRPSRAAARQHAAGRQISRRGVPSRRRRARRGQRTDEAQAHPQERPDRQRQDDRRELQGPGIGRRGRDLPDRHADEAGRRLHRAARQSVRRRDHEDERDRRGVPSALSLQCERPGRLRGPRDRVRRAGGLSPPHRGPEAQDRRALHPVHPRHGADRLSRRRGSREHAAARRSASKRASTRFPASATAGSPARRVRPRSSTPRPKRRPAAGSRCCAPATASAST